MAAREEKKTGPLAERIRATPFAHPSPRVEAEIAALSEAAGASPSLADLATLLAEPPVFRLIAGIFSGSPYLTGLIKRDLGRLQRLLTRPPEEEFAALKAAFMRAMNAAASIAEAMQAARVFKTDVALLTALADLADVWPVMDVTRVLTETADAALQGSVRFLFRQAAAKGEWVSEHAGGPAPEGPSGFIVLGMGKYGAGELNYSSDIDLIVFYDAEKLRLKAGLEPQRFCVRLARDLVRLMEERTPQGYVFRTDLRLRPDAGATQIALSTEAALHYYESFGQNWERAALIKARPVAGDLEAGAQFLEELQPFIWRKYLDYAAIADVHAMKRQIHAYRGLGGIGVAGHNVKLGSGGIREIEFFVQTQQLIAGGRQPELRTPRTLTALDRLAERRWIEPKVAEELSVSYLLLRRIEHRIQMVLDEQTHVLPSDPEALENFALFAGYPDLEQFSAALLAELRTVRRHYAALFEKIPELTTRGVNMVFAGEEDDPDTVAALSKMGYSQPGPLLATVRGWHHGRYPAVRSPRARERLTEVQPLLIETLAQTGDPDAAFASFDRFLSELPSGVQLFSLLKANPGLLRLIADIMGTAPRLARSLSRRRRLLDAVIDPRTFRELPDAAELDAMIAREIGEARDLQDVLDRVRVVGSEQAFLIGVRVLSGTINAGQAGGAYALLAERLIAAVATEVEREMNRAHGRVAGGGASIVAMGKLGGREMTAASDLDLIVVYDFDPDAIQSDGQRPLAPTQYFARLTQRLISALTAPTAEGSLYEVDMRLRPSGQKGPLATQLSSFVHYQANEAWTWEHMALTRARVLTGPRDLNARVEKAIRNVLVAPRDPGKIAADVRDMRQRIWAEKGTENIWELKQVRGGLVDLEFIAQYLQLVHAAEHPDVLDQNTLAVYRKLQAAELIEPAAAAVLVPAARLLNDLTQVLRVCLDGPFDPATAPDGLKELLARAGDEESFPALEARLRQVLAGTTRMFTEIIG